jgi:hypothetical protein
MRFSAGLETAQGLKSLRENNRSKLSPAGTPDSSRRASSHLRGRLKFKRTHG